MGANVAVCARKRTLEYPVATERLVAKSGSGTVPGAHQIPEESPEVTTSGLGWRRFGAAMLSLALLYRPPLSSLSLSRKGERREGWGLPSRAPWARRSPRRRGADHACARAQIMYSAPRSRGSIPPRCDPRRTARRGRCSPATSPRSSAVPPAAPALPTPPYRGRSLSVRNIRRSG